MKFRTEIHLPLSPFSISHSQKIMAMGSCFSENISGCLEKSGFRVDSNPFGIVYNPASLSQGLRRLMERKLFAEDEIFQKEGAYSSFWHNNRFSEENLQNFLSGINSRLEKSSVFLQEADLLILTFGTAYVYRLKDSDQVVSNCHKFPADRFLHQRLGIEEITTEWEMLVRDLKAINPELRILFTVSPIRHWKDGAHENQLSKSILLIAIDEIVKKIDCCSYFPSYELLLDDLRDYRFYAEDLFHPSSQAVEYIWEKFSSCFFTSQTQELIKEWESIQRDLNHKPFRPDSEAYIEFRRRAEERERKFFF